MRPKISVIVPIYKTERFLHACIESILAQSFADFELILVNDGSPDNSAQICEYYQKIDSRIRFINKQNGGISSARNAGLDVAKGSYIMFVDSDDYLENGCFERAYTTMISKNMDLYIGGSYEVDEASTRKTRRCVNTAKSYSVGELMNQYEIDYPAHWLSLVWGKLFKTGFIENNRLRFDTGLSYKEDALFIYSYLQFADEVYFDDEPVCNYRIMRDGALNRKVHRDMYEINCKVYKLKRDLMMVKHCKPSVYNHVYFCSLMNSIEYFYMSDHHDSKKNRGKTIEAVCENEILPQISLCDVSGFKRKLMFVLCRMRAKKVIAVMYWLRSRIHS